MLLQLVDRLFESPVVSVPATAKYLKVTQRSAAKAIEKLADAGILIEVIGKERYRFYAAKDIIDIIEASDLGKRHNPDGEGVS